MADSSLISRIQDLKSLCEKRAEGVFSKFLDASEQAELEDSGAIFGGVLFGGHELCERKMFGVFPEWEEPKFESFPIRIISISYKFSKELSHRDYLGSLMGLGIERDRVGDILVRDCGADVFVHESIADYVLANLKKIGSVGIKLSELPTTEFDYPKPKLINKSVVCASMRLDSIVSSMLNISRSNASALINHEKIEVNHRIQTDASKKLKKDDLISARGFGRFLVGEAGGETRSGKIHLSIFKYE